MLRPFIKIKFAVESRYGAGPRHNAVPSGIDFREGLRGTDRSAIIGEIINRAEGKRSLGFSTARQFVHVRVE